MNPINRLHRMLSNIEFLELMDRIEKTCLPNQFASWAIRNARDTEDSDEVSKAAYAVIEWWNPD